MLETSKSSVISFIYTKDWHRQLTTGGHPRWQGAEFAAHQNYAAQDHTWHDLKEQICVGNLVPGLDGSLTSFSVAVLSLSLSLCVCLFKKENLLWTWDTKNIDLDACQNVKACMYDEDRVSSAAFCRICSLAPCLSSNSWCLVCGPCIPPCCQHLYCVRQALLYNHSCMSLISSHDTTPILQCHYHRYNLVHGESHNWLPGSSMMPSNPVN